ncbi:MAG TPA: MFS transporter [Chloroflexaceae bacterium]|nr:MFS transporter [Chloroflexaceae bacterium]
MSQLALDGAALRPLRSGAWRLRALLAAQFALLGLVIGAQSVLWSDIKLGLGLGDGVFGTAMMLTPLVGFVTLLAGGPWRRLGQRPLALAGLLAIAGSVLLLATARTLWPFLAARVLAGLGFALLEGAVNRAALGWERSTGRQLVGLIYAMFSGGMVTGALAAGALVARGLGYGAALALLVPALLLVAAATAVTAYPQERSGATPGAAVAPGGLRDGRFLLLACLALLAVAGEAVADLWGVIYLRTLGADALAGSVVFALFNGAMILGRLANGPLIARWGARAALRCAWVGTGLAAALLGLGGPLLSAAAFTLIGLAVAGVIPTLLSLARAGRAADGDAMVNRIVATTYLGFVVVPPVVGWLAELWGLQPALLLVLATISVALWRLARRV